MEANYISIWELPINPIANVTGKNDRRGQIKNRISIEQRPEIVEQKARIGDWEGDTVIGKGHKGALLTLVERKTLYTLIVP